MVFYDCLCGYGVLLIVLLTLTLLRWVLIWCLDLCFVGLVVIIVISALDACVGLVGCLLVVGSN